MTGTATVEKQGQDDIKPQELEPEKTIEDEQLEAAIVAADKEDKEAKGADDPAPAAAAPGAVADAPTDTDPAKVGAVKEVAPKMVPVGVVTALRKENSELKHSNANLAGQVQGMQAQGRPGDSQVIDPTPKPKPFDEQLGDLDTSLLAIAQKVDDGEISNEDAEKQRIEVRKQEREILAEMNRPQKPATAAVEPMQDLGLEEHMSELVKAHPVLTELNQAQMEPLRTLAYEQAERDGNPIIPGALGTKNLRERMAKFATQLYGTQDPAPSGDEAPAAKTNIGLSAAEIAKRDKKLELAQTHPTDTSQLGSASDAQMVSDEEALARMENMNAEEQIAYLDKNPALMQRLEGTV